MSKKTYMRLLGTGSYLPKKIVTNDDLSQFVETSDEWIKQRVGIHSRHFAEGEETTLFMAERAAKKALAASDTQPDEIGLVLVATTTPDYIMPSVASTLQAKLGIPSCPAMDINAACSGFVYMVDIAKQYIENGACKKVLLVASERLSRIMDWKDRSTCILFGDGAGATVFGQSDQPGVVTSIIHSNGNGCDMLNIKNSIPDVLYDNSAYATYLTMEGNKVFRHAVAALSSLVTELLDDSDVQGSDIDWLVPHQANYRIISAAAKKLKMPMDRVVVTLDTHGNTSAASIPLALDYAVRKGMIVRGETILLEAFGAGLVWGGCILKY